MIDLIVIDVPKSHSIIILGTIKQGYSTHNVQSIVHQGVKEW